MGKGKRLKHKRKNEKLLKIMADVFDSLTGSMEPLNETLIQELVQKGWNQEELHYLQSIGGEYCRERDSVFTDRGCSL